MDQGHESHGTMTPEVIRHHYRMLGANLLISLVIMYLVMFAMIYSWGEFVQNINFFYMALMMWAPMGSVMLLTMAPMYRNRKLNLILHAAFGLIFILSAVGIRQQLLVGDNQFLRSMIPHHSGAVLMCKKSTIRDPEVKRLCEDIIASQTAEIEQMKEMLDRGH
jgi:uncharacterized protein (DUF305 family)